MYPKQKMTIIGGGIAAAFEAYFAWQEAKKNGQTIRVTINEKNTVLTDTTTINIAPSLTPDEIVSVVPRGPDLLDSLAKKFSEPGGIRIDDVQGINDAKTSRQFIDALVTDSKDEASIKKRAELLLAMGKESMDLWQGIYDEADTSLKAIMEASHFSPCLEPQAGVQKLQQGYRIDLIYDDPNVDAKVKGMISDYGKLGYKQCKALSPAEVKKFDPALASFCDQHSQSEKWEKGASAILRPGGCINTSIFLPKFLDYLKDKLGKYTNHEGKEKDCFRIKLSREVESLLIDSANNTVEGIRIKNPQDGSKRYITNKRQYESAQYVLAPGEAVGTLDNMGLKEPAYTRFAGPSLKLKIPLTADLWKKYESLNHCMEVHKVGIVLAWQARANPSERTVSIEVAGTKSFYGDVSPNKNEEFARNRNLLQLNMVNDAFPDLIRHALGDVKTPSSDSKLTEAHLSALEEKRIAARWVGTRAVAYDGFPTLGAVYNENGKVPNARTTTHLGSGGVSFGPAAVLFSQASNRDNLASSSPLIKEVLDYADSRRKPVI